MGWSAASCRLLLVLHRCEPPTGLLGFVSIAPVGHVSRLNACGNNAVDYKESRLNEPSCHRLGLRTHPRSTRRACQVLHINFWHGLWAPKGTPREIIAKINAAVMDTLADPAVRKRFTDIGQEIFPRATQQTSDALRAHHKAEIEKWWPISRRPLDYKDDRLPDLARLRHPAMSAQRSLLEAKRTCCRHRGTDVHDPQRSWRC